MQNGGERTNKIQGAQSRDAAVLEHQRKSVASSQSTITASEKVSK